MKQRIEGGSVYEGFSPITRSRQVLNKPHSAERCPLGVAEACNALIASAVSHLLMEESFLIES